MNSSDRSNRSSEEKRAGSRPGSPALSRSGTDHKSGTESKHRTPPPHDRSNRSARPRHQNRMRSQSPSDGEGRRGGNRGERKARPRRRRRASNDSDHPMMEWNRSGSKSPAPHRTNTGSRMANHRRRSSRDDYDAHDDAINKVDHAFDDLAAKAAKHPDPNSSNLKRSVTAPVANHGSPKPPPTQQKRNSNSKRASSKSSKAAMASSNDIDEIIAAYRDQVDVHMATLLELKNNITTTEKAVAFDAEKDKEFQQVRQWYSALAEKHTKLQKEHQTLQEEHVKLQEKYMNFKRAAGLNESFVAHFSGDEKSKPKKDKNKLEVVWSRAGKITKNLHQKLVE